MTTGRATRRGLRAARAALLAAAAGSAAAQEPPPLACGETYAIRRGDSLQDIAERVYGPEASWVTLYEANRARHGWTNPSLIEVGEVIDVPCPPGAEAGAAPETQPAPALPPEAEPSPAAPPASGPALRVAVTTAGGEEEAEAIAALARAAFDTTPGEDVAVEIVGAGGTPASLAEAGYALSLPWPAPDCGDAGLPAPARAACEALVWTEPVYERLIAAWRLAGEADPEATPRLCLSTELRALDLYPEAEALLQAEPEACVEALLARRAALAAMSPARAAPLLAGLDPGAELVELPDLARVAPLAAAGPAEAPEAAALAERLETGLAALRASGRWFEIVRAALSPPEEPAVATP